MRKLDFLVVSIFLVSSLHAQSKSPDNSGYQTALGVKVWDGSFIGVDGVLGLDYKFKGARSICL